MRLMVVVTHSIGFLQIQFRARVLLGTVTAVNLRVAERKPISTPSDCWFNGWFVVLCLTHLQADGLLMLINACIGYGECVTGSA